MVLAQQTTGRAGFELEIFPLTSLFHINIPAMCQKQNHDKTDFNWCRHLQTNVWKKKTFKWRLRLSLFSQENSSNSVITQCFFYNVSIVVEKHIQTSIVFVQGSDPILNGLKSLDLVIKSCAKNKTRLSTGTLHSQTSWWIRLLSMSWGQAY